MKQRCLNPDSRGYKDYGARNITVCQRWIESFVAFYEDMGPRPAPGYSIDRFPDQNGNYCPENCRWATVSEQTRNKRNNKFYTFNGKSLIIADWAVELNMPPHVLKNRLQVYGWSVERALTEPVNAEQKANSKLYELNGKSYTVKELVALSGKPKNTLKNRLVTLGWSAERAISTPIRKRNKKESND